MKTYKKVSSPTGHLTTLTELKVSFGAHWRDLPSVLSVLWSGVTYTFIDNPDLQVDMDEVKITIRTEMV